MTTMIIILIITHSVVLLAGFILGAVMAMGKRADMNYGDGTYGDEKR